MAHLFVILGFTTEMKMVKYTKEILKKYMQ